MAGISFDVKLKVIKQKLAPMKFTVKDGHIEEIVSPVEVIEELETMGGSCVKNIRGVFEEKKNGAQGENC